MPAAIILGVAAYTGVTAVVGGAIGAAITGAAVSATAATAIGTAVIAGGITAAQGGKASDVLKSAVLGGITAGVGASISASIASDVAFNAIASGTPGQLAVVMGNAIGGAAAGAISSGASALLSDRDPVEALIRGGLTAGLSAGVNSAVYEVTKNVPLLSNPSNKIESAFQRATKTAIATGILGGSASDAFTQSVITSFGAMGFDYIKSAIKDYTDQLRNSATDVETAGNAVNSNIQQQNQIVADYQNLANQFNSLYNQIAPAQAEYDAALAENRLWASGYGLVPAPLYFAKANELKAISDAKLATLNQTISTYNNFYNNNIGTLNGYVSTLDTLKAQYPELLNTYAGEEAEFKRALEEFQVQEAKNATLALKGLEDTAVAKRIFVEQEGREPTDAELAQYATNGDLVGNVDRAKTTRPEAVAFWKQTFGTEPTEFDLLGIEGLAESDAQTTVSNIYADRSTTDSAELDQFIQNITGGSMSLTTDQKAELLGLPESDAQSRLTNIYNNFVADKNSTDGEEATALWNKSGIGRPMTADELQMMMRGSEATAETYAQRLADIESVTFKGDPFADQAAAAAAAKAAGYNNYTYNGQTYIVNDDHIAASFDGGLLKEATRLIDGALAAKGIDPSAATSEQLSELVSEVHRRYGNDVSQLKAATIQDFIQGSAPALNQIELDIGNGKKLVGSFREILDGGSDQSFKDKNANYIPEGVMLATPNQVDSNQATRIILPNGVVAYVVNKPADEVDLPSWFTAGVVSPEELNKLPAESPWTSPADALAFYANRSKEGLDDAGKSTIDAAKTVVDLINSSGISQNAKENIIDAVAVTLQGTAELTKLFSDAVWATGAVNRDNAAARIADAVGKYGASLQSASTKQQEENILKAIADAKGAVGTIGATIKAIYQNPAGALTLLGKEAVQEGPVIAASGGVGRLVLGLGGKALAYSAAMGTSAALDATESFASGYGETYDNIKRAGGTDEYAKAQAYKSGYQSALVGAASSMLGDSALVKKFMGEMTNLTLPMFGKEISKQYVTNWGEGFLQNASTQYNSYGTVNWANARTAGAFEGLVGTGVAGGILAPNAINYQLQVARDLQGNPVTLQQVVDGTIQVDPSSINTSAPVFNINGVGVSIDGFTKVADTAISQPDFSFTSYSNTLKSLYDTGFTDNDVSDIALQVSLAPNANTLNTQLQQMGLTTAEALTAADVKFDNQVTTNEEVENAFDRYSYFNPDTQAIESFTGLRSDEGLNKAVEDYIAPRYTTPDEARAFFESVGYKPSEQEIAQFAGQVPDATQRTAVSNYAAQNTLDIAEVKAAAALEGITLTDEQARQYVRQAPENQAAAELRQQLDPTKTTTEEAVQFLRDSGFTEEQARAAAAQFVGPAEATAQQQVAAYTDPRQVTFAEAKKFLTDLGYTPTDEEVNQFVQQSADPITQAIQQQVGTYVDPRQVTVQEVKNAAAAAGIPLTDEEAAAYAGQKSQEAALGTLVADITRDFNLASKQDIKEAIAGIEFPGGITTEDVTNAIADYMQANPGLSAADVSRQVAAELEKLPDYATPADVSAAVSNALFNYATRQDVLGIEDRLTEAIEAAKTAGLQGDAVLDAAIKSVAADLGTSKEALLAQIGTTEQALRSDFASQLGAVTTELGNVETRLTAAIDAAKAAGLEGDAALQAGLDAVAADLGITRENLLTQLGTTESALRAEIAASQTALGEQITTGLEGIKTDLANAEARINERAAQYEALGLSRDQALSTAISDVAAQLGTTATNLTSQIDAAKTALGEQITAGQTALQEQINQAAELLGKPAQAVTQQDLDFVNSVITQQQTATTPTPLTEQQLAYDVNQDQRIDQADIDILTRLMTPTAGEPPPEVPAGTRWAPTGLFGEIAGLRTDIVGQLQQMEQRRQEEAAAAEAARQAEATAAAERARQAEANARARAEQQRLSQARQQLFGMLQQPGAMGTPVQVKTPEVAKLGPLYTGLYDPTQGLFRSPEQEKFFQSPFGTYFDGGEVTEEELLQIVRG